MKMNFVKNLREFKRLIRVGLPLLETPAPEMHPEEALADKLTSVIGSLEAEGIMESRPSERLPYLTLKTEFEFTFGSGGTAATQLSDYLDRLDIRGRLDRWKGRHSRTQSQDADPLFYPGRDPRELKQQIWALMAVVFYRDYLDGENDHALGDLQSLRQIIESELTYLSPYSPHGSLARVHYFLGQCSRSAGDFPESNQHFLVAQKHAGLRLERELRMARNEPDSRLRAAKIQYEYQFGVICTARILGSRGRTAMFQGKLHSALELFCAARTLLVSSGQAPLTRVIETHIAIVEARSAPPGSTKWKEAIEKIDVCYKKFEERADADGIRRCAQELARAHLDLAEARGPRHSKRDVEVALEWIQALEDLADSGRQPGRVRSDRLRALTLRAWACLAAEGPDTTAARTYLEKARELGSHQSRQFHFEFGGFDRIELRLVEGLLRQSQLSSGDTSTEEKWEDASAVFRALMADAVKQNNPVLESEALLRLAIAEIEEKKVHDAQVRLQHWRHHGPNVENASLQSLYQRALKMVAVPSYQFLVNDISFDEQFDHAGQFLCEWAVEKFGADADAEDALGLKRGRISDMRKRWRARQHNQAGGGQQASHG